MDTFAFSSGFFVIIAIIAVVLMRLAAGSMDGARIEQYIREMGGTLIDKSWDPFGPGWFSEKDSRIYEIVYRDKFGCIHRAHVKTSLFSGVYLTNDRIIEKPASAAAPQHVRQDKRPSVLSADSSEAIEREKIQLRQRLAELERISPKERGASGTPEEEWIRIEKP